MALTSPTADSKPSDLFDTPAAMQHRRPRPVAVTGVELEPDDGVQTGRDLVVKNALVFGSAGVVLALAAWLLV